MEMCMPLWNAWRKFRFCSSHKSSAFPYKSSGVIRVDLGVSTFPNYFKISDFSSLLTLGEEGETWGSESVASHLLFANRINHFLELGVESALSSWSLLAFWYHVGDGWWVTVAQTPRPLHYDFRWHRPSCFFRVSLLGKGQSSETSADHAEL